LNLLNGVYSKSSNDLVDINKVKITNFKTSNNENHVNISASLNLQYDI